MAGPLPQHEKAYRAIRRKLLQSSPDRPLNLTRRTLAKEVGVSMGSLQVALARLEGEGLLESLPQSETRRRQIDPEEYHELHDLRELIECYAARRAAWWISDAQVNRLRKICDTYDVAVEEYARSDEPTIPARLQTQTFRADTEFHGIILRAARNMNAVRIIENFHLVTSMAIYAGAIPTDFYLGSIRRGAEQHRAITEALAQRDADAAERLMREHLDHGRVRILAGPPLAERCRPE